MRPEKPEELEFYLELLIQTYRSVARSNFLRSSTVLKDVETLERRSRTEGLEFLTRTLPSLGKALDKCLAKDEPFPDLPAFKRSKHKRTPVLFGGLWELIFDLDGRVREEDDGYTIVDAQREYGKSGHLSKDSVTRAVAAVRQICYLFYKLDGSHTKESEVELVDRYVAVDESLPLGDEKTSPELDLVLGNAKSLISLVLKDANPLNIRPSHGPGAVSTGEKMWEKMNFSRMYVDSEDIYPFVDFFMYSYTHLADELESVSKLETRDFGIAKAVLVPKDSRGPRLICMEPLEKQWLQQGIKDLMVKTIESNPITSGYVNFTDQEINRSLALDNSHEFSEFITLDLREASDRVSIWLVNKLFPSLWQKCLMATRSKAVALPDERCIALRKFASMGSATCFPVEALVFWALAVSCTHTLHRTRDLYGPFPVYVYGDDIVVPKEYEGRISYVFHKLHLELSKDKCCTGRFFRESCGMDAFRLKDVTPVRVKRRWRSIQSPEVSLGYISNCNLMAEKGLDKASSFLMRRLRRELGHIPTVNVQGGHQFAFVDETRSNAHTAAVLRNTFKTRFNRALQRWEVKLPSVATMTKCHRHPSWSHLLYTESLGSPPSDPFGFCAQIDTNLYSLRRLKMRTSWVALEKLLEDASGEQSPVHKSL